MNQQIDGRHEVDAGGLPFGGVTSGTGLEIKWQKGPLIDVSGVRQDPNGAFVEGVINAAIDRIQWYQVVSEGRFRCRQNSLAITKLEEALHWLNDRTLERQQRGVEGTHEA